MGQKALKMIAWSASILCCLYFAWAFGSLIYFAKGFTDLYSSLGVELPAVTRIILATYRFMFPALFCADAAFVVVKEIRMTNKWASLGITLGALVAVFATVIWFKMLICYPVANFTEKLK
jgi:hypothetical protein